MRAFFQGSTIIAAGLTLSACATTPEYSGEVVGGQRVVEVRAKRFEYTPSIITVKRGETVVLKFISEDVTHGLFIDGYEKQLAVPPGEVGVLGFTADKTGRFTYRCSMTCGRFHAYMVGHLKVLPNTPLYAGVFLIGVLGVGTLALNTTRKGVAEARLFGLVPLSWRFDITRYKPVRVLFKSRWFPLGFVLANFVVLVAVLVAGLVGGLSAGNTNFGVMIVWILWWALLLTLFVPFLGRFWCMTCPFPLIGDWLQRGALWGPGRKKPWGLNKKWPKRWRNLWPVTTVFVFATFFVGFFTVTPFATFVFLAVVVLAAVAMALIYEKRTFCLYACPVSGFQGLYANFAAAEVRVKDPGICATHTPKTCYVGNEQGCGCPWMELPFDLNRNTYCGLCLECFKTCPHDNMVLNLRPPGTDLLADRTRTDTVYHRRGLDEAFKSLTLIGVLFAFFLTMQGPYGWIKDMVRAATLEGYAVFLTAYVTLNFLLVPGAFLVVSYLSKLASGDKTVALKQIFVDFSYCLIPLGLARWAAFSLGIFLPNGGYLPRVVSDPFARGWDLFGTAGYAWSPFLTGTIPYLQTAILVLGLAFSLEYGYQLSKRIFTTKQRAIRGWIPMLLFVLGLSLSFVWLFEG